VKTQEARVRLRENRTREEIGQNISDAAGNTMPPCVLIGEPAAAFLQQD
jgi:hypothetical protein